MNLIDMLLEAGNGSALSQIGSNLGLDDSKTRNVIQQLAPALSRGLQRNTNEPQGLSALARALAGGKHQKYLDQPARLARPGTVTDGNAILGHLFGSKDVSRNVAAHASRNSGVDTDIIKKMLPMVAAMAMGALSKRTNGGAELNSRSGAAAHNAGGSNLLASLLDADGDGSMVDDVLSLAKKFI